MSSEKVLGLHHMTAICGPAQDNVDFFVGVLGLRFLKLTVNFDDPTAYHLYYGDGLGTPGTTITFFPYPMGRHGVIGNGQVGVTSLSIPQNAIGFWTERLRSLSVPFETPVFRGDEEVLGLASPDGTILELVAAAGHRVGEPWKEMPIAAEHAISRMRGVRLFEAELGPTEATLLGVMGLEKIGKVGDGIRYRMEDDSVVDVVEQPDAEWGRGGHGTVHHIAFRARNDEAHAQLLKRVHQEGLQSSPIIDRNYFHSIYFREPGHVLFEIATDQPGFTYDESPETLGTALKLPAQYEPHRAQIEATLPKLRIPGREGVLS
jgi:glyoxalase family protein